MAGLTLYHAPKSRSQTVLAMLEELGEPFAVETVDFRDGGTATPEFRALNPLGKVPVLRDAQGAIVTETVAILLHLADLYPGKRLAPAPGEADRGRYLRWMVFYAAAFEPALVDRHRGVDPGMRAMSPYGEVDLVIDAAEQAASPGPWILGERFSAADLLWGAAFGWTMAFGLLPKRPAFAALAERIAARPAMQRARARDAGS